MLESSKKRRKLKSTKTYVDSSSSLLERTCACTMIPHDPQLVCKRRYLDHFTDHTFLRVYIFIKITEPAGPAVFRVD